jgi:hypothetical protein
MKKIKPATLLIKLILIAIAVGMVGVFIYAGMLFSAFGLFDKTYSVNDLINNYNERKAEIYEVKHYINKVKPKFKDIDIEFDGNNIGLTIMPTDTGRGSDITVSGGHDLKLGTKKLDSLLYTIGWNNEVIKTLQDKLESANCISVKSGEPSQIGFKRSGFGMYFYNVFDTPISPDVKKMYSDTCAYIYLNRYLILEYGGGAIGPQCFPRKNSAIKQ